MSIQINTSNDNAIRIGEEVKKKCPDRLCKRDQNEECQTEIILPYDRGGMPEVKSQMPETISSPSPLLYSAQVSLLPANAGRSVSSIGGGGRMQ